MATSSPSAEPERALGGHRLVGVGDGQDARLDRDLLADQAEGLALAVRPLVVRQHPGAQVLEVRMGEQARADLGMRADRVPLVGLQRAPLAHQPIRHAGLADVVHQPRKPDRSTCSGSKPISRAISSA